MAEPPPMTSSTARIRPCTITLPNQSGVLPLLGSFVRLFAAEIGFDEDGCRALELAVDEAASNVVQHAFFPDDEETFSVVCEGHPRGVKVRLREKGIPFDTKAVPVFQPGAEALDQAKGLGLFLIRENVDEVHFHNRGPEGKELQLIKYNNAPSPLDLAAEPIPEETKTVVHRDDHVGIRLLGLEDALEATRCVYSSLRYTYQFEWVYYPEQLVALQESGGVVSAVAVLSTGEVVGYSCLIDAGEGSSVLEFGLAVVNPEFRGQGLVDRLADFLDMKARERESRGLLSWFVTTHTISQKIGRRSGYLDCALAVGAGPATQFRKIERTHTQRETYRVGFRKLEPQPESQLYFPPQHSQILQDIFTELAWSVRLGEPHSEPQFGSTPTRVSLHIGSGGDGLLEVKHSGPDVASVLHAQLHHLLNSGVKHILVLLDLQDPNTAWVATQLEEREFFFAGLLPGSTCGEALLLQYLNGVKLDYSAIHLTDGGIATKLLDYIRARDPAQT